MSVCRCDKAPTVAAVHGLGEKLIWLGLGLFLALKKSIGEMRGARLINDGAGAELAIDFFIFHAEPCHRAAPLFTVAIPFAKPVSLVTGMSKADP
jgi:hypothetical protein